MAPEANITAAIYDLRVDLEDPLVHKAEMLMADVLSNQQLARGTEFGQILAQANDVTPVLAMAALAHSIELDDMHRPSSTHPGSAVVAGALHTGAQAGRSGREVVDAVIYGVEVLTRVATALGGHALYERGYHPSSYCAAFGVAAAAAKLLRLPKDQFEHALGLAGVQAAGLMCGVEQGPMSWYMQYGRAAAAGAAAAQWAAAGMTGPQDILGAPRGLLDVFGRSDTAPSLLAPETLGIPN
ncbi:MAG: MmgE/PrpD family protein, partial [Chloroflexi bacterium]|nr:MmgE/PrpD family protein [Chloroflexota bacterium]